MDAPQANLSAMLPRTTFQLCVKEMFRRRDDWIWPYTERSLKTPHLRLIGLELPRETDIYLYNILAAVVASQLRGGYRREQVYLQTHSRIHTPNPWIFLFQDLLIQGVYNYDHHTGTGDKRSGRDVCLRGWEVNPRADVSDCVHPQNFPLLPSTPLYVSRMSEWVPCVLLFDYFVSGYIESSHGWTSA